MKKTVIFALGMIFVSSLMIAKLPEEIVRVVNKCPNTQAKLTAYYQTIAKKPLIGMSAPRSITLSALPGKEVDFVFESPALGGSLQRIEVVCDKFVIEKPQAGSEYTVQFTDNENWLIRQIRSR